jgi:16S rRNA (cytidine1402-2'-O)-methyltransferase
VVTFVATPIGNLEDIGERGKRTLEEAEIILAEDTRVAKKLLQLLGISLEGKRLLSLHHHNSRKTLSHLTPEELRKKRVVYISDAGMPGVSDPGSELVQFCQKKGIPYTAVPGPSAPITAYLLSGFGGEFTFFGFLPSKGREREKKLEEVLNSPRTAILLEAPHRLPQLLKELKQMAPERQLFLAKELTKKFETFYYGTPSQLLSQIENWKGEWVVVISPNPSPPLPSPFTPAEIQNLPLPPKQKAKLLSKLTGKSAKEIYKKLIEK